MILNYIGLVMRKPVLRNQQRCNSACASNSQISAFVALCVCSMYKHVLNMSHVMRKPKFCICENKDADQLRGNREADQRLCFRYIDSTIPLLSKPLAIFCSCTALFVSDQVGNQNAGFLMTRLIYLKYLYLSFFLWLSRLV